METLKNINFASLLDKNGEDEEHIVGLNPDVVFVFMDANAEVKGEIRAHKLLLSLASKVFREEFSGARAANGQEKPEILRVIVTDATYAAFQILIRFTYSGEESLVSNITDLDLLIQIAALAKKYFFTSLWNLTEATIHEIPLSVNNYASVLRLVAVYEKLLPLKSLCKSLGDRCVLAVARDWSSVSDCTAFWLTHYEDDPTVKLSLMEKMSSVCFTCTPPKMEDDCPWEKKLTEENARVGMLVKYTNSTTIEGTSVATGATGTIQEVVRSAERTDGDQAVKLSIKWTDSTTSHGFLLDGLVVNEHSNEKSSSLCEDDNRYLSSEDD